MVSVHPTHSEVPVVLENNRNCRNSFIYVFSIRSHAATEKMTEYVNGVNVPVHLYTKLPGIAPHAGANAPRIAAYHRNCLISSGRGELHRTH